MKRLFCVKTPGGKPMKNDKDEVIYFDEKQKAKSLRDVARTDKGYTVGLGPDHHRFNEQE